MDYLFFFFVIRIYKKNFQRLVGGSLLITHFFLFSRPFPMKLKSKLSFPPYLYVASTPCHFKFVSNRRDRSQKPGHYWYHTFLRLSVPYALCDLHSRTTIQIFSSSYCFIGNGTGGDVYRVLLRYSPHCVINVQIFRIFFCFKTLRFFLTNAG